MYIVTPFFTAFMNKFTKILTVAITVFSAFSNVGAQNGSNTDLNKFRQLGQELPTPNPYRAASGAPGHNYWQQKVNYDIKVALDDEKQTITGSEVITYINNSPDMLKYIWVQLDQNIFESNSIGNLTRTGGLGASMSFEEAANYQSKTFDGGYTIKNVKDESGKALAYTINGTMMRIDLPVALAPKGKFAFSLSWFNNINEIAKQGGRGGFEYFPEDKNNIYEIAQWFPRMAVYDDVWGWQTKQYIGTGEFALEFGNYKVAITVPADHIVAATGELKNAASLLTTTQKDRLKKAETADKPICIVTEEEARKAEKEKATGTKTWIYEAENVRDFAWASSRKFIWDAQRVSVEGKKTWAMSYYPKEGNPLWGKYSTRIVAHTLKVYSKHSVAYPYPVAISVHGPVFGMEYPMICFNGGRPEADGTYSERLKYGMLGVIIHEVGHNFFPMIVSSDERQWSWMDEGLNTFLQYLTEKEWDKNFPSGRGEPYAITDYMKGDKNGQVPIMVNSESALQFGNNAYGKPATALNILRETILGRELFDFAFKSYSNRWAFKHPNPADFFRSMEDASGTDLDWFWRGWFYTTDHVDISIKNVQAYTAGGFNIAEDKAFLKAKKQREEWSISKKINNGKVGNTVVEQDTTMLDFYNHYDMYQATEAEKKSAQTALNELTDSEKRVLNTKTNFYKLTFENLGGLVMPVIVRMVYSDGSDTLVRIPTEIWRYNDSKEVSKVFATPKPVMSFELDPYQETADCDMNNNFYPQRMLPNRFKLIKAGKRPENPNPMRTAREEAKKNSGK